MAEPFDSRVGAIVGVGVRVGAGVGVAPLVGAGVAAASGVIGILFTGDPELAAIVQPALLVLAVAQPLHAGGDRPGHAAELLDFLDGFDSQSIAFATPVIAAQWGLNPAAFGPVFGAGQIGLAAQVDGSTP